MGKRKYRRFDVGDRIILYRYGLKDDDGKAGVPAKIVDVADEEQEHDYIVNARGHDLLAYQDELKMWQ